jgi:hypothetical protein
VPYTGALDPFDSAAGDVIGWPEGEKDVDTLVKLGIPALTFGGTGDLPAKCEDWVAGRHVVIMADNDEAGRKHAEKKVAVCLSVASSVKVIHFPETEVGHDVTDWLKAGHTKDELESRVRNAPWQQPRENSPTTSREREWPTPKPLPAGLVPVEEFDLDFLPQSVAPWVGDTAERMQCPADFVGVSAIVGLGSVVGRRLGVRPQQKTDWTEVPNMWGCVIGRPGALKSPAMTEALKPLQHLDHQAQKANEAAMKKYSLDFDCYKLTKENALKEARKNSRNSDLASLLDIEAPEEPPARRYITNDTTYEALAQLAQSVGSGPGKSMG